MNNLQFTADPSKKIWGFVITLVTILGCFVFLVGCQPTTVTVPEQSSYVTEAVLQTDQETAIWAIPAQKLTRIFDEEYGIVCYVYTDRHDFGTIQCFEVDEVGR